MSSQNREAYKAEWYQKNRERILASRKKDREENPEKLKAIQARHYLNRKDYINSRVQKYKERNREKVLEDKRRHSKIYKKRYYQEHRQEILARNAFRYARRKQRTPKWLTKAQIEEIRQIYLSCPKGYHVDHIIPLHGEIISGLHVPSNLQHLPASENIRKKNRFNPFSL